MCLTGSVIFSNTQHYAVLDAPLSLHYSLLFADLLSLHLVTFCSLVVIITERLSTKPSSVGWSQLAFIYVAIVTHAHEYNYRVTHAMVQPWARSVLQGNISEWDCDCRRRVGEASGAVQSTSWDNWVQMLSEITTYAERALLHLLGRAWMSPTWWGVGLGGLCSIFNFLPTMLSQMCSKLYWLCLKIFAYYAKIMPIISGRSKLVCSIITVHMTLHGLCHSLQTTTTLQTTIVY